MPGNVLMGRHRGSEQGLELDGESGISDFSYAPVVPPLLAVSNNDLLTDQRVDWVVCRERRGLRLGELELMRVDIELCRVSKVCVEIIQYIPL